MEALKGLIVTNSTYAPERILDQAQLRVAQIDAHIRQHEQGIAQLELGIASYRRAIVKWRNERAEAARFLRENGR
jgi:hypothetical protein